MHGSRLMLGLAALILVAGCKDKNEAKAPATKQQSAELLEVPVDVVYAASAHIRVVDVGIGQSVRGIDLQRAITSIAFSPDGAAAYVGASDGLREVDSERHEVLKKISDAPVRQVLVSPDGQRVFFLEHDVVVKEGGLREPSAFRLGTYDRREGKVVNREVVGERVLQVVPAFGNQHSLLLLESGTVALGTAASGWTDMRNLDLAAGQPEGPGPLTPRPHITLGPDGRKAYVPVEGGTSRVLEIELVTGTVRSLSLGTPTLLRGLAVTPDARRLVVNGSDRLFLIDLEAGEVRGELALEGAHTGAAIASDGRRAYLAQTVDGTGGAVSVVRLEPLKLQGKIHIADISPWVLAVRPRPQMASRD